MPGWGIYERCHMRVCVGTHVGAMKGPCRVGGGLRLQILTEKAFEFRAQGLARRLGSMYKREQWAFFF